MPAFEWSSEHNAYIKECVGPYCLVRIFIGTDNQDDSITFFMKHFYKSATPADGLAPTCKACYKARCRGSVVVDEKLLLKMQEGKCKMCGTKIELGGTGSGKAAVDHDHRTTRIRGLLCLRCNTGLGYIEDERFMVSAKAYLQGRRT